jgi:hypothetical protein
MYTVLPNASKMNAKYHTNRARTREPDKKYIHSTFKCITWTHNREFPNNIIHEFGKNEIQRETMK